MLAPLAVDQAEMRCPFGHESVGNSAASVSTTSTRTRTTRRHAVKMSLKVNRLHQTGLHRWRPSFAAEPQRPVWSDEVIVAPHELDMAAKLVCATSVARRAPAQVRRRLTNREVEAFNERGVQGFGILRRPQRSLQATRGADLHAPLDSDDTIVPPGLQYLTVDAR